MIQKILNFTVNETTITRGDSLRVVADNQNYYRAKFELSEDWTGIPVTALFVKNGIGYPVLLDESLECNLPPECMTYDSRSTAINVSMFGGDRKVTKPASVPVDPSGWTENIAESVRLTPTQYEQLLAVIPDGLSYANSILKMMIGDKVLAEVPIAGGSGTDAREIELQQGDTALQWRYVGDMTWTDLILIGDIKGDPGYTPQKGVDYFDGSPGTPGKDGEDGVSPTISVSKAGKVTTIVITTATSTETITVTDGTDGTAGRGIVSVTKKGTVGLVDTYTILYSDNNTVDFTVTNGSQGTPGTNGTNGTTFTPSVDANGNLSWSNDGNKTNPSIVNIKGPAGTTVASAINLTDAGSYFTNKNVEGSLQELGAKNVDWVLDSASTGTVSKELVSTKTIKISTALTSLTLTLPTGSTWHDNYAIEFCSAALTLPTGVVWDGGTAPTLSSTKWYLLTIFDGIAFISQGVTKA